MLRSGDALFRRLSSSSSFPISLATIQWGCLLGGWDYIPYEACFFLNLIILSSFHGQKLGVYFMLEWDYLPPCGSKKAARLIRRLGVVL